MTPNGEHLKDDSSASPSSGKRLGQTGKRRRGEFLSSSDGYQHGCCLWEKRAGREGSFQPHGLPGHREAAEHRHRGAHRAEQHQAVRLLLPQRQGERPLPGCGPEWTQITDEVGLNRAAGDPTQIPVASQPGPAALHGATRVRPAELPLARRAVLLLPRRAAQHMRLVVRECVEVCSPYRRY
ncbi:hypothetical protein EYF80_023337 [Liparis tanakae]|uniref:Uncharacterized protein n=1 Tax=Liparis tanakae TaxID=230148 RepID=A0A4Z2HKM0_9TELE|nr:hypothetical protein EYF80_023337 [Liparis tanakae]